MNITIRKANKEDCPRLLELVHELAEYERAPNEVTVTLEEFEQAGFTENPIWKAFVAEADGKIQGFALYYIRFSTWKGCRLYLEDLIVTEDVRGKGLGRQLFETVLTEARSKGYNGVTWQVLDWNEPALNFYNKYQSRIEDGWLNGSLSKEQIQRFNR